MLQMYDASIHDVNLIAGLIYDADPEFNRLIFGEREQALPRIIVMTTLPGTFYSSTYLRVIYYEGNLVGIVSGYPVREKNRIEKSVGKAFAHVFGMMGFVRKMPLLLQMRKLMSGRMDLEGYYIVYLSVSASSRGKGIGSSLIEELAQQWTKLYLHVSIHNSKAIRFYERNGFIKIREAKLSIDGKVAGANLIQKVQFPTQLKQHPGDETS
jgi:ribosomal protein S18 acetylase RimI-like enzyme